MFMCSLIYTQCTDFNQLECSSDNNCEWVEEVDYYSCSGFSQNQCYQYESCSWTLSYGGGYGQWSHTCSGSYEVDNSFCEETLIPDCSEEYEFQCIDGSCIPIHRVCNNINDCEDESDEINCEDCSELEELECSTDNLCEWGNGQCQEIQEEMECSELLEFNCDSSNDCEWTEDIDSYNCNNISDNQCMDYEGCWLQEQCVQWGSLYTWICYEYDYQCSGGIFETDNSYCEEFSDSILLGDYNLDGIINVLDIIQTTDLILSGNTYSESVDMNNDGVINIIDIIVLIDIIIGRW